MDTLTGGLAPQQTIGRSPEVARWLYDNIPVQETTRFKQLDRYEAHYKGTQYVHLQHDWWGYNADTAETVSPSVLVPRGFEQPAMAMAVRAKRPTAPYHLARAIVDRYTGLLFSKGRRPEVVVENDATTEEFLRAAMLQCRFWPAMRQARVIGGSVGSVAVTVHLRDGKFAMEVHNGKHLHVLWRDRRTFKPRAILKQYVIEREQPIQNNDTGTLENKPVKYLVRRIMTEHEDIVFKPAILREGEIPQMEVADSVEHNLGFFPGVWIQNLPVLEDDDGDPDCQGTWQSLDTIDRLLAQGNKGTLLNMDPTLKMKVDPKVVELGGGVRKGSDNSLNVGTEGDAAYLEINGAGITVAMELVEKLKQNVLDMTSCVLVDPETISGSAQSAKAIEYIYAPMLEKADVLRDQYGDMGIVPLCEIIVKMSKWADDQGMSIDLPRKVTRIEPRPGAHPAAKTVTHATDHALGSGGHIKLTWGPYFTPSEQDKQLSVNTIVAALTGGLIDDETAVKVAAPLFDVKEPGQMYRKIKEEQDAMAERELGGLDAGMVQDDPNAPKPPGAPGGGPPKPGQPKPPGDEDDDEQDPNDPFKKKKKPPTNGPPAGFGGKP